MLVKTKLGLPGNGKGRLSHVTLPIRTGLPRVVDLKNFKSEESRQGRLPFIPITPFKDLATINDNLGFDNIKTSYTYKFLTYTKTMTTHKKIPKFSLVHVKYTLIYIVLIPLINWSFTWAPMIQLPLVPEWAFNPVTVVTGLVLVARDFSQREIGHEVLIAMCLALFLTFVTSGGALALASGAAFLISELIDYALFTLTSYKLSTRVLLSSSMAAPIDTLAFLYGASFIRDAQLTIPNISMSIAGKMFGAIIIWALIKHRLEGNRV